LVNLADELAYNAHDIDDGVRSGLLDVRQLAAVPLFVQHRDAALAMHPPLREQPRRLLAEALRRMLSAQVQDVIAATQARLEEHRPQTADDVRELPPLVCFGESMREQGTGLKRFLFAALYRHPQVMRTSERARDVVRALFAAYAEAPAQMTAEQAGQFAQRGPRVVADYIAGMTDRFASREYARLTGVAAFVPD
jgi:dGTP triphosphohydrolase